MKWKSERVFSWRPFLCNSPDADALKVHREIKLSHEIFYSLLKHDVITSTTCITIIVVIIIITNNFYFSSSIPSTFSSTKYHLLNTLLTLFALFTVFTVLTVLTSLPPLTLLTMQCTVTTDLEQKAFICNIATRLFELLNKKWIGWLEWTMACYDY